MLGRVYFWKNNVEELSFATAKTEIPKTAYKSSIESKNIDQGTNVEELKKAIAEQKKKDASHSDSEEGEENEERKHVTKEKFTHQDNKNDVNGWINTFSFTLSKNL